MALYTDSDLVTLDHLLQFESTLDQVSSTHAIDVTKKIKLAVDATGDIILLSLLRAGHSDPQWLYRASLGLSTVVVTPAIFKWLCMESLSRTFAEAYNLQLNTRFQGKLDEYKAQSETAGQIVFASGIGVVLEPLAKPVLPDCTVEEGIMTAQSLFLQTTWINARGEESAPSPVNGLVLNGFSKVQVSCVGNYGLIPASAVGWNVYASESQETLTRQNLSPTSIGQPWTVPDSGVFHSGLFAVEQTASRIILPSRRWLRG